MKPKPNISPCTSTKTATTTLLDPSLTIHLENFSLGFKSRGASPLTSPDSNILERGVDRVRSDIVEEVDVVSDRTRGFSR